MKTKGEEQGVREGDMGENEKSAAISIKLQR